MACVRWDGRGRGGGGILLTWAYPINSSVILQAALGDEITIKFNVTTNCRVSNDLFSFSVCPLSLPEKFEYKMKRILSNLKAKYSRLEILHAKIQANLIPKIAYEDAGHEKGAIIIWNQPTSIEK